MLDDHLEFWAKFQRHKCKQRLTKLHQMIIRKRKLKISGMHTQEEMESINKRYEKRETKREAKALIAAKLETAIEKELLNRLQQGTYKGIYNLDQQNFNKELDVEEEQEEDLEGPNAAAYAEDYGSEEDDDSVIGGDLDSGDEEEGENEIEEELSDEELAKLEKQEQADRADIENADGQSMPDKKAGKTKLGKRKQRPAVDLEYEEEHETERVVSKRRVTN